MSLKVDTILTSNTNNVGLQVNRNIKLKGTYSNFLNNNESTIGQSLTGRNIKFTGLSIPINTLLVNTLDTIPIISTLYVPNDTINGQDDHLYSINYNGIVSNDTYVFILVTELYNNIDNITYVYQLEIATNKIINILLLPSDYPNGIPHITCDNINVWVTQTFALYKINISTFNSTVTYISSSFRVRQPVMDGINLWMTGSSNRLIKFDGTTFTYISGIPGTPITINNAISVDSTYVWVGSNNGTNILITPVLKSTFAVQSSILLPYTTVSDINKISVSSDNISVYVTTGTSTCYKIKISDSSVTAFNLSGICSFVYTNGTNIWISTNDNVYMCDLNGTPLQTINTYMNNNKYSYYYNILSGFLPSITTTNVTINSFSNDPYIWCSNINNGFIYKIKK